MDQKVKATLKKSMHIKVGRTTLTLYADKVKATPLTFYRAF